jgi:hypothetical protein
MLHRYLSAVVALVVVLSLVLGLRRMPAIAAPADVGYRDFEYGSACNSTPTGEKPESKLWWNDGSWWGSLCAPDNTYHIFRLDLATQTWLDTGTLLDDRPSSKADTLWDGQKLYVASHLFSNGGEPTSNPAQWGRLYRYSYNAATKTYSLDTGFPVTVTRGRSETLVLEKAPSGQLWVTYVERGTVMVNHTLGGDEVWAAPFALPVSGASNLNSDDISAIITFDRSSLSPQIGVLWSNQQDRQMYFATHPDGAPQTAWTSFGLYVSAPGSPSAADDHINIKLQSDGAGVYAITKTSNEGATEPLVVLLSCRSACSLASNWFATPVYTASEPHTRATLLLDTSNRKVNIFSTTPESGGRIDRAIFDMDMLSSASVPESKSVFIANAPDTRINNTTSTKQAVNSATGLVVLASDQDTRRYLHNYDALAGAPPSTPSPTSAQTPTSTPSVVPTNTPTATSTPTQTPIQTPISGIVSRSFLPLISRSSSPDLVGSIALVPNTTQFEAGEAVRIDVTITNIGNAPSTPAWVDLYINPSATPAPSTPWNAVCGLQPCFGLVWIVPALAPGQRVTLSSSAGSYAQRYSIWPGWFASGTTDLYLYVDSWNPGVSDGAIFESDESNNQAELPGLLVSGPNPTVAHRLATTLPARRLP